MPAMVKSGLWTLFGDIRRKIAGQCDQHNDLLVSSNAPALMFLLCGQPSWDLAQPSTQPSGERSVGVCGMDTALKSVDE